MHGLHSDQSHRATWFRVGHCILSLLPVSVFAEDRTFEFVDNGAKIPLAVRISTDRVTQLEYHVTVAGTLVTPAARGLRHWDLDSEASLKFIQRQLPPEFSGPLALKAVRYFKQASSSTRVGKNHRTKTALPGASSLIYIRGSKTGLHAAASRFLSRAQFDLLQMPCDPLFCASLLPSRDVCIGEKWNTDSWVLPRLVGLEAVSDHVLSCEFKSLDGDVAQIQFNGRADGAVVGSASTVELVGTLKVNVESQLLVELKCQLKEKRSTGPVSPGLDALVNVTWTQSLADRVKIPTELNNALFDKPLVLETPWRLVFHHSHEWHIFNQNDQVIMLRQIRDGVLVSQCNVSTGVMMPPGQHTSDPDFRSDVKTAIRSRNGQIISEDTIRNDEKWRIRHIQASGRISDLEIIWDYYLCTAATGDQYSLMFSHSAGDTTEFGDEANQLLRSLSLVQLPSALPFRN